MMSLKWNDGFGLTEFELNWPHSQNKLKMRINWTLKFKNYFEQLRDVAIASFCFVAPLTADHEFQHKLMQTSTAKEKEEF